MAVEATHARAWSAIGRSRFVDATRRVSVQVPVGLTEPALLTLVDLFDDPADQPR
jgi:hypothetical protein